MLLGGHDAGDVFLQLVVVFLIDQALATFDCKHDLDIDLGISVGHVQMMPLLTELENLPLVRVYKDDAPDGALAPPALSYCEEQLLALNIEIRQRVQAEQEIIERSRLKSFLEDWASKSAGRAGPKRVSI